MTREEVDEMIAPILGMPCCRKQIGQARSLSLGFGERVFHQIGGQRDQFRGKWELVAFGPPWRVANGSEILCGSEDSVDSIHELDIKLDRIPMGPLMSIRQLNGFDIRLELENGITVDFLAATSEEETLHIFLPGEMFLAFGRKGWSTGRSGRS